MSCSEIRFFNDGKLAHNQKYKEMQTDNNNFYPSLHEFKKWLLDLEIATRNLLLNQQLFMGCFWGNTYKEQGVEAKNLAALLLEIRYQ